MASLAVGAGGNWEMTQTEHKQEKVYAQRGLGFVRLAMATGPHESALHLPLTYY